VTVARAKRTHRTDARRRYRNEQALGMIDDDAGSDAPETGSATTDRPRPDTPAGARRGVAAAFREAFRPLDMRADLLALPRLLRTRALWVPILLTLVSGALFVAVRPEQTLATAKCSLERPGDCLPVLATFLFQYFIVTPAIGGVFIAGFLAPRASWLLGVIVGLVAAGVYSILVLTGYIGIAPTAQTEATARDVVFAAFIMSPIVGAFFASAAAWYRRFLQLSNPNRGRPRPGAGVAGRRPDGRSRAADANQKAGARR